MPKWLFPSRHQEKLKLRYQIIPPPAESQERALTSSAQFLVLLPLWLEAQLTKPLYPSRASNIESH